MSETPTERIRKKLEKESKEHPLVTPEYFTREQMIERIEGYTGTLEGISCLTTNALIKLYNTLRFHYK